MPDFLQNPGPMPTDPLGSTVDLPVPSQPTDFSDLGYSVLPDLQVPVSPVVVQASPCFQYAVSKIWLKKSGLSLQPVGGPPGTPADVIRYSAPYGHVVLRWISRRRGAKPIIPSEDQGGQCPNEVLLESQVCAAVPGHFTTGEQCWQVSGTYIYGLRVPYSESDVMVIGAMPYTNEVSAQNALTPDMYSTGIAGPDIAPAGRRPGRSISRGRGGPRIAPCFPTQRGPAMAQFSRDEYMRLLHDVLDHEQAGKRRYDGPAVIYPTREEKVRYLFGKVLTVYRAAGRRAGPPRHFPGPGPLIAFRDGGSAEAEALFADGYTVTAEHP